MSSKVAQQTLPLTPLPELSANYSKGTFLGVATSLFAFFFATSVILPFVPFMVHEFFPNASSKDLGYYTSYIDSAFFIGCILSALIWSSLSDIYGRKPILLIGLIGSVFTTVLFGLSLNYTMALVSRFLWGALDGNITISKTILGEISNKTNQSKLYAIIAIMAGLGKLTGNIIGGLLVLFHPFPLFKYAMPCLMSAIFTFFTVVIVGIFVKETLQKQRNANTKKYNKLLILCQSSTVRTSVFYSGILGFLLTSRYATLPLWLLLPTANNGFNYHPANIGIVYAFGDPIMVTIQYCLFKKVVNKIGYIKTTKIIGFLNGVLLIFLPHLSYFNGYNTTITMLILGFYLSILSVFSAFMFSIRTAIVNNCSDSAKRATVNGYSQMMVFTGRFVAPIIMCNLFSYTINQKVYTWINYCSVFYLQGLISILSALYLQVMLPNNFEQIISLKKNSKKMHVKKQNYNTFKKC